MDDLTRKRLGLSQELLASWLGVTRAVLAQVETGRRSLPLGKMLQDLRLDLAAQGLVLSPPGAPDPAPQPAPPPLPVPAPPRPPLQDRLAYCRYHIGRLRYELGQLQTKAARHEARLKALPALRAYRGPVPNPAREENWLALIEGEAVYALQHDCGAGPQRLLEARIAGLEREAELLETALTELPTP